ncbi:hypothetical protein HK103_006871 [Boothiomyces macroporosus]|uniref:ARID domain-containing protein n=1 Tax=Boothiomyces macroporosus TaxID=261099 RepID=A0AAD5UD64_9FUNG|nr:hypothetical protein HK103_006871 [Boothiomyces macroporosus]
MSDYSYYQNTGQQQLPKMEQFGFQSGISNQQQLNTQMNQNTMLNQQLNQNMNSMNQQFYQQSDMSNNMMYQRQGMNQMYGMQQNEQQNTQRSTTSQERPQADSAHSSPNLNMLQMQNQRQMYYQLQNQQNNQNMMFNQQGNQQAQVNQQQSPALQQRYQMNQQIPINNNQTQALYYQQLQQQGGQFNQGDQSMQFNQSNLPQTQVPSSTFAQNNQLGLMNQMSGNSQLGGTAQVPGAFSAQNFVNNNQSPTTPQVALSSIQSPQSHGNVYQQTQFTPTVNSMTTFQGPQAQLNERSYFENAFNSFLRQRNPAARVPPLDGKPLDTFLAFHVVIQDGGFEKVRNQNSWPAICHKLGIDVNPMNITTLQAAYQTFLYPLEQMVNRSAIQRPSSAQSNPNISAMSPAMASTPGLYNNNYMNANQPPTIPKPQTPPLPKAPPVIPEAKVVPPEPIDPATYYPKAVKLQSFGGIDLTTLGAALHRVRPAKEHYAPKDLRKLNMSLKSKMPLQVKFALDCLSIYSAEFNLKFAEYPDLLNSLVYHMEDCLKKSTENRSNDKFYSYKELFEYEWNSISQLQDNCVGSIDVVKNLMEEATTIGLILRNASMHPENHALMSQKEDLVQMLFWTLNLPVPEAIAHLDKSVSGTILSYPVFHVLEHRKNAVIILSNIGHNITIPNDKYAQLLIDVCTDFISEANTYYVYPATDLLARVLLQSTNQILIGACSKLLDLANVLLKNLPWTGLPIDAQPSQLALWELTMLNLNSIIGLAPAEQKSEIIAIPSLMKVLYLLSKRPVAQYAVPPELLMQFTGIRERSFRTYIECTRFSGKHSKKIETELLQRMVIAQRDQEAWLVAQILDFLSDYGE